MTESSIWEPYAYRVVSAAMVTPVVRELWLTPRRRSLPYLPGQYVLLSDAGYRVPQRSYSLANAPRPDGTLRILVTLVPNGATSTWAHGLRPGDDVLVEGPFGTFTLADESTGPVLLLGAGSGLAPVKAIAEELRAAAAGRRFTLVFSGRTAVDAIDRAELQAWDRDDPTFDYVLTLTRDPTTTHHAHVPELVPEMFADLSGWQVFTSGPPGFVTRCARVARELGAGAAIPRSPLSIHNRGAL